MEHFIPETPKGVSFLKALTEGPIDSHAEFFLCELLQRRSQETVASDAPIGLYNIIHLTQAGKAVPPISQNAMMLPDGQNAEVFNFKDGSHVVGFTRSRPQNDYFDGALAILPVALKPSSLGNLSPHGVQNAIAKDLPLWHAQMAHIPRLNIFDIIDSVKEGKTPTWAQQNWLPRDFILEKEGDRKLTSILDIAAKAFQVKHQPVFFSFAPGRSFFLSSRSPDRSGKLSDLKLSMLLDLDERERLEDARIQLEREISAVASDPSHGIPFDRLIKLVPDGKSIHRGSPYVSAILAETGAISKELSAHEKMAAIADWDNLVEQAKARARMTTSPAYANDL